MDVLKVGIDYFCLVDDTRVLVSWVLLKIWFFWYDKYIGVIV